MDLRLQIVFFCLAVMLTIGIFHFFPQINEWSTKKFLSMIMGVVFIILTVIMMIIGILLTLGYSN